MKVLRKWRDTHPDAPKGTQGMSLPALAEQYETLSADALIDRVLAENAARREALPASPAASRPRT